jgi:hypothetical protein
MGEANRVNLLKPPPQFVKRHLRPFAAIGQDHIAVVPNQQSGQIPVMKRHHSARAN